MSKNNEAQLSELDEMLLKLDKTLNSMRLIDYRYHELWTYKDIAHYFRCSESTVKNKIVKFSDFPEKICFVGNPRWVADEVRRYASQSR